MIKFTLKNQKNKWAPTEIPEYHLESTLYNQGRYADFRINRETVNECYTLPVEGIMVLFYQFKQFTFELGNGDLHCERMKFEFNLSLNLMN